MVYESGLFVVSMVLMWCGCSEDGVYFIGCLWFECAELLVLGCLRPDNHIGSSRDKAHNPNSSYQSDTQVSKKAGFQFRHNTVNSKQNQ